MKRFVTKELIIEDFKKVEKELGRIPNWSEYFGKYGKCGRKSVYNSFKSWNNALLEIFGQINKPKGGRGEVECNYCHKMFLKRIYRIKTSPKHFCSQSCLSTHTNTHKTKGFVRSKLEIFLEQNLKEKYHDLEFLFNEKKAIDSELDIYIPNLKLAFELDGPLHYKPIFGEDKLIQIQRNDKRKTESCEDRNIKLIRIDVSKQGKFNETIGLKYLSLIEEEINSCLCIS